MACLPSYTNPSSTSRIYTVQNVFVCTRIYVLHRVCVKLFMRNSVRDCTLSHCCTVDIITTKLYTLQYYDYLTGHTPGGPQLSFNSACRLHCRLYTNICINVRIRSRAYKTRAQHSTQRARRGPNVIYPQQRQQRRYVASTLVQHCTHAFTRNRTKNERTSQKRIHVVPARLKFAVYFE